MSHICEMNVDGNVRELLRNVTAHDHVAPLSDGVLDAFVQVADSSSRASAGTDVQAPISLG